VRGWGGGESWGRAGECWEGEGEMKRRGSGAWGERDGCGVNAVIVARAAQNLGTK
jgi:hypothetical protein